MDSHQTSIYTAILISSLILGSIILFFVLSIIYHQRRSNSLYKLSIQTEINTLERERGRIAADLHDELGPFLSAIKFKVGSLDIHSPEDEQTVDKIDQHIDKLVDRMREISNDLMPNILLHKGVAVAVADFIENSGKTDLLNIQFAHQDIPELPAVQAIHIYRIIMEIIHNTIKHAQASQLVIEFKGTQDMLVLQTRDNGKGFDYNLACRQPKRFGLRNLLSRAELLSANVYTDTGRGKGTLYIFEIPYKPTNE